MVNINFEQTVNCNRNGTDNISSISKNLTKFPVSFYFFRVSDVPDRKLWMRRCTYISGKNLGALIGAGALNRANTVFPIFVLSA